MQLEFGAVGRRELWVLPDGRLWEPAAGELVESPALQAAAARLAYRFSEQVFGEPLPWPQADALFPDGSRFVLEDVRTGRWLSVQRYGGYRHADVEPLTRSDTAVLRELFGGQWSWRRRPVVAVVGDRRVAGSINGMPHGGGALAGNEFPGHFCLHFWGSWLHLRARPDPSHQLMVRQAAGQLAQTLERAPPAELASWLLAAVQEGDEAPLMYATEGYEPALARRLMQSVRHITVLRLAEQPGPAVDLSVVVYRDPNPNLGYPLTLRLPLRPRWPAPPSGTPPAPAASGVPPGGWVVPLASLEPLLHGAAAAGPVLLSGGYPGC